MTRKLILRRSSHTLLLIKPTLIKKRWFRRCIESLGKNDIPFLFGFVEQAVEIDVVHQCYPDLSSPSPEKLHCRFNPFCITISRRFAISVTQIWILMALALSP